MTINHLTVMVTPAKMSAMRTFYRTVLKPLGYTELVPISDSYIGFGSDYPYLWLQSRPDGSKTQAPVHVAIDAPGKLRFPRFLEKDMC